MTQQNQFQNNNGSSAGAPDIFEYWLSTFGNFSWSQEQAENLFIKMMEQQKVTREDTKKIMEDMIKQAKTNQEQLTKIISEGMQAYLKTFSLTTQAQLDALSKKIDELNQKLDNR